MLNTHTGDGLRMQTARMPMTPASAVRWYSAVSPSTQADVQELALVGGHLNIGPKQHVVPDGDGRAVQQAAIEIHVHPLANGHVITLRWCASLPQCTPLMLGHTAFLAAVCEQRIEKRTYSLERSKA